jgi:hypothetical protein
MQAGMDDFITKPVQPGDFLWGPVAVAGEIRIEVISAEEHATRHDYYAISICDMAHPKCVTISPVVTQAGSP